MFNTVSFVGRMLIVEPECTLERNNGFYPPKLRVVSTTQLAIQTGREAFHQNKNSSGNPTLFHGS